MTPIWPLRHLGLKALSLGLAVLIWMIVAGEETVERGLRVPLELQQFPAGLELQGESPSYVDVRVRGASGTLSRMSPADIIAVIDLHAARPGPRFFQLTPEQVRVPFGVQVVQVTPANVALTFENSKTRTVPVSPSIEGSPEPGYVEGGMTVDPKAVDVIGPESSVDAVTEAITEPISIAGARAPVTEKVTIGFLDPVLRLKSPRLATVTVQVLPGPAERKLRERPVHLRNLAPNLSAQAIPAAVQVILRGTRQTLNRVDSDDVTAFVDLSGLGPGDHTVDVRVAGPQDASVTPDPATVQVRITSDKD